ncbi:MAG: Uma2 family endonuclease [Acidobacteria bacterium]|nr:Uma2 family endonuclease [Acidobacteriota bacterium]
MSSARIPRITLYTLEEYFAIERVGMSRYEYWDGEIICMSGGSFAHSTISGNIFGLLREHLRGKRCRPFTADQPIKVPALPPYRYADASVVCGDIQGEKVSGFDTLVNPTILVEVLSPDSVDRDLNVKGRAYQEIPSLREYVVIAQESPTITLFARTDDGNWQTYIISGLENSFELASIEGRFALADVFEGVEFSPVESAIC